MRKVWQKLVKQAHPIGTQKYHRIGKHLRDQILIQSVGQKPWQQQLYHQRTPSNQQRPFLREWQHHVGYESYVIQDSHVVGGGSVFAEAEVEVDEHDTQDPHDDGQDWRSMTQHVFKPKQKQEKKPDHSSNTQNCQLSNLVPVDVGLEGENKRKYLFLKILIISNNTYSIKQFSDM